MFENVEEPEARLNLALLGTEDALLAGTAAANDIFGAAPGAGSYGDARIGIAIVLHGSFSTILGSGASARNRWNRAEIFRDRLSIFRESEGTWNPAWG